MGADPNPGDHPCWVVPRERCSRSRPETIAHSQFTQRSRDNHYQAAPISPLMHSQATRRRDLRSSGHVDHPFLFAIQHAPSGACLFLGHVADPSQVQAN